MLQRTIMYMNKFNSSSLLIGLNDIIFVVYHDTKSLLISGYLHMYQQS